MVDDMVEGNPLDSGLLNIRVAWVLASCRVIESKLTINFPPRIFPFRVSFSFATGEVASIEQSTYCVPCGLTRLRRGSWGSVLVNPFVIYSSVLFVYPHLTGGRAGVKGDDTTTDDHCDRGQGHEPFSHINGIEGWVNLMTKIDKN